MPKLYNLCLPIIAPVLLWQGKRLKRDLPRLPEAAGARSGNLGQGNRLRLLIIGDSAAAGVGAQTQELALSGQLTRCLSQTFDVSWQLMAKSGADIRSCIGFQTVQQRCEYDVILVSIGVNDVTGANSAMNWQGQLEQLITLLGQKYSPKHIVFTKVPPMQKFGVLKHPLRWYLGARSRHFNQILSATAAKHQLCSVLEIGGDLSAEDMASDGFHPGPRIYQHWGLQAGETIAHLYKENTA